MEASDRLRAATYMSPIIRRIVSSEVDHADHETLYLPVQGPFSFAWTKESVTMRSRQLVNKSLTVANENQSRHGGTHCGNRKAVV